MASRNVLPITKVVRLKPGDKKGWATVSGQIPPELARQFDGELDTRGLLQTDLVHEAIAAYFDLKAA